MKGGGEKGVKVRRPVTAGTSYPEGTRQANEGRWEDRVGNPTARQTERIQFS